MKNEFMYKSNFNIKLVIFKIYINFNPLVDSNFKDEELPYISINMYLSLFL